MIKLILFDFDGVIVDSSDLILSLPLEYCEKKGMKKIPKPELKNMHMKERFKALGLDQEFDEFFAWEMPEFEKRLIEQEPAQGIKEVLADLKESYALSIVSSTHNHALGEYLDMHGLNYFDNVVGGAGLFSKEEVISKVLDEWGFKKEEAIYVGDETRDVEACKKAGIKVICSTWGIENRNVLEAANPDFIADDPAHIVRIVRDLNEAE